MTSRNPRLAQKKRERLHAYIALTLAGVLGLFSLLAFLSHRSEYQIQRVGIMGAVYAHAPAMSASVIEALSGSYGGVFPRTNRFIYPSGQIKDLLANLYPSLQDVSLDTQKNGTLVVAVTEYTPHAIWCRTYDARTASAVSGCYFLDENARIFARAPDFSSSPYPIFAGGLTLTNPLGHSFVSAERFKEIEFFLRSLSESGVDAGAFVVRSDGDFEVHTKRGTTLLVSATQNFSDTLANLALLLDSQEIGADIDRFFTSTAYIDLRFGNRLYYKEHGTLAPQDATSPGGQ